MQLRNDYWPHAPRHDYEPSGTYMVTASTYLKTPIFHGRKRLDYLQEQLFKYAQKHQWELQAWAVFANHYHVIALSPKGDAKTLRSWMLSLHTTTAMAMNKLDQAKGRRVWNNFWESRLDYQRSYLARLHYVMTNPEWHGVAQDARQYPWCSASWFQENSTPAFLRTVTSFKTDRLRIADDYPVPSTELE